eukprot:11225246-Lingulodinium_polyedra.AAC.1
MLWQHDRKEMNELLERRLSPTLYADCKSQPDEPGIVDEVISLVQQWLEAQRRFTATPAQMSAATVGPTGTGNGP